MVTATPCANMAPTTPQKVIRFGLYPLLTRPIAALSTGEVRKVLLCKALLKR